MATLPKIQGFVTKKGYIIKCDGGELYKAMSSGEEASVPFAALEGWCDQTGEEIAKQLGGTYIGHIAK